MKMYNYGMSIAVQYAKSREEAEEIAQDGFYKMLKNIDLYKDHIPFKLWLRRIIINCGIDHYRKHKNRVSVNDNTTKFSHNAGEKALESEYLIRCIQSLSPVYRMVFNLYVVEGFSHKEIAEKLDISVGASKSNLSKARRNLKNMIEKITIK